MDEQILTIVRQINKPRRVIRINAQLLSLATNRYLINGLNRRLTIRKIDKLKQLFGLPKEQ